MWLCEGKLKGKTAHFRSPSASQKRACLSSLMLEELCKTIQHCCATLQPSRNKRNVGSCWLKSLTSFKLRATNSQQHAATCNRVCILTQHVTPNNVGTMLANHVASVNLHGALGLTGHFVVDVKIGRASCTSNIMRMLRTEIPIQFPPMDSNLAPDF